MVEPVTTVDSRPSISIRSTAIELEGLIRGTDSPKLVIEALLAIAAHKGSTNPDTSLTIDNDSLSAVTQNEFPIQRILVAKGDLGKTGFLVSRPSGVIYTMGRLIIKQLNEAETTIDIRRPDMYSNDDQPRVSINVKGPTVSDSLGAPAWHFPSEDKQYPVELNNETILSLKEVTVFLLKSQLANPRLQNPDEFRTGLQGVIKKMKADVKIVR